MDYNNSFTKELDQLVKSKDILSLPHDVYDYIKAQIISNADSKCNYFMSEIKKMVSRGEYISINDERIVSHTSELPRYIKILDNIQSSPTTSFLKRYLSDSVNANALRANCIRREYRDGIEEYKVDLFKTDFTCYEKENFFGFKNSYSIDINKAPFADLYLNALKDNLRQNGITYQITLEFHHIQRSSDTETIVKKFDITDSIPHVHEFFETPRVSERRKLGSFDYQMLIETTVSF